MGNSVYPVAFSAFAISYALIALLLGSRLRALLLDRPNERSLHALPVPRVGGLAIIAGALLSLTALNHPVLLTGRIAVGVLVLAFVSLTDDARGLPILPRLLLHLAACAYAAWPQLESQPWLIAFIVAAAMAWMVNLYNFMDGADGLAGGMSVIGFGFLAFAACSTNLPAEPLMLWSIALSSSSLAFLCFNFSPARVFMGDCGSVPLGFSAAWLAVYGVSIEIWPVYFPLLVFAPFILDASCTLCKRMLRGERFWQAHREHYYQRLIRMGWSHRKTALFYYSLMLVCGTVAVFSLNSEKWSYVSFGLLSVLTLYLMAIVDKKWKKFQAAMVAVER